MGKFRPITDVSDMAVLVVDSDNERHGQLGILEDHDWKESGTYFVTFADGKKDSIQFESFDQSDGLKTRECNGGTQFSAIKDKSGKLWFSTIRGVSVVDPNAIKRREAAPAVVRINNAPLAIPTKNLPYQGAQKNPL